MLYMYNNLLWKQTFPEYWKVARVVLLPKKGKYHRTAKGFRPICLINTMGKLYENMILQRLEEELTERNVISGNQHGFTRGRSTTTAMLALEEAVRASGKKWLLTIGDAKRE